MSGLICHGWLSSEPAANHFSSHPHRPLILLFKSSWYLFRMETLKCSLPSPIRERLHIHKALNFTSLRQPLQWYHGLARYWLLFHKCCLFQKHPRTSEECSPYLFERKPCQATQSRSSRTQELHKESGQFSKPNKSWPLWIMLHFSKWSPQKPLRYVRLSRSNNRKEIRDR